jgi:hypothetical protein
VENGFESGVIPQVARFATGSNPIFSTLARRSVFAEAGFEIRY